MFTVNILHNSTWGSFCFSHFTVDCNVVSGFHCSTSFFHYLWEYSKINFSDVENFTYLSFFGCISSHILISESVFVFVCLRFFFNQGFTSTWDPIVPPVSSLIELSKWFFFVWLGYQPCQIYHGDRAAILGSVSAWFYCFPSPMVYWSYILNLFWKIFVVNGIQMLGKILSSTDTGEGLCFPHDPLLVTSYDRQWVDTIGIFYFPFLHGDICH